MSKCTFDPRPFPGLVVALSHQAMVASTYTWVLNQNVVVTQSIYTVEACNQDQALVMDIRKEHGQHHHHHPDLHDAGAAKLSPPCA